MWARYKQKIGFSSKKKFKLKGDGPFGVENNNEDSHEENPFHHSYYDSFIIPHSHPLLLSPVIKCIYKYLGLEDIKNCRLVSREWNWNSKFVLRDRSKIIITNGKRDGRSFTISEFLKDFSDTQDIPFHAFAITNYDKKISRFQPSWKLSKLNKFFESQQDDVKELELFERDVGNTFGKLDITPWISRSPMTKPNTKYNTKLLLRNDSYKRTMSVSLSSLLFIKNIKLDNVTINVYNACGGPKMNPVKLDLNDVRFSNGKIELYVFCINDIVDFSKCQEISFSSQRNNKTKMKLNLYGNEKPVNFEKLELNFASGVNLSVNWANSSWKIKYLRIVKQPILEPCGIDIVKLDISCGVIDLSCLPQSIEVVIVTQTYICNNYPIPLRNLKYLYLEFVLEPEYLYSVLSHFKSCPKLVEIVLQLDRSFKDSYETVEFDWIPKSVRRIRLINMLFQWKIVADGLRSFDQVVFDDFVCDNAKCFCIENIQVKDIILNSRISHKELSDLLKYFGESCKQPPQRIFAGPFELKEEPCLSVDKISEYYVFEKQKGKAIDEKDFNRLVYP